MRTDRSFVFDVVYVFVFIYELKCSCWRSCCKVLDNMRNNDDADVDTELIHMKVLWGL